jgi:hypothetical protein
MEKNRKRGNGKWKKIGRGGMENGEKPEHG